VSSCVAAPLNVNTGLPAPSAVGRRIIAAEMKPRFLKPV
jgi:hypothetical protein